MTADHHGNPGAGGSVASEETGARNLGRRVVSALVLAPVALGAAYLGGWAFTLVSLVAAAAILREWASLATHRPDPRVVAPGLFALGLAAVLAGLGETPIAIAITLSGAILAGLALGAWPQRDRPAMPPLWGAGGVIYAGILLLSAVLLRNDPDFGLRALLFLFTAVWATDILAYFVGRAIGGPLLWPRLSPNKTWAGALGGLVGGVAATVAVAYASGGPRAAVAGTLALILSIAAQAGDLLESAVKRRFGVKDTSNLIPGHGGMMDRLDGFLVAAVAAVLIGILRQGLAAPARGLLVW